MKDKSKCDSATRSGFMVLAGDRSSAAKRVLWILLFVAVVSVSLGESLPAFARGSVGVNSTGTPIESTPIVAVQVTMLDGEIHAGYWKELRADGLVLVLDQQEQVLPLSSIASVQQVGKSSAIEGLDSADSVQLVDGSTLKWKKWESDRKQFEVVAWQNANSKSTGEEVSNRQGSSRQGSSNDRRLIVDNDWVRAIRRSTTDELQWQNVVQQAAKQSDAVVVKKGEQLDWIDAVIRRCSSESIAFNFQGRDVEVPVSKVAGLVFFVAGNTPQTPAGQKNSVQKYSGSWLTDIYQQRWLVSEWQATEQGQIQIQTAAGLKHSLSLDEIRQWNFADLRFLALSSCKPDRFQWQPLVSVPGQEHLSAWNAPRRGVGFDGSPLQILRMDSPANSISKDASSSANLVSGSSARDELMNWIAPESVRETDSRWENCQDGLAVKVGSDVTYQLQDSFQRLTGTVGLAYPLERNRKAKLVIKADQNVVLEITLDADSNPSQTLDVELDQPGRLVISVQFDPDNPLSEAVHFDQLRLLK